MLLIAAAMQVVGSVMVSGHETIRQGQYASLCGLVKKMDPDVVCDMITIQFCFKFATYRRFLGVNLYHFITTKISIIFKELVSVKVAVCSMSISVLLFLFSPRHDISPCKR